MKVLIIEDERPAAEMLRKMILGLDPEADILKSIDSVKGSVEWFQKNPLPDLVFMDIQLGDGLSFEIFERIHVPCPVIFTTAYDEYAIRAFKVNSLDYLLKPVNPDELEAALEKYRLHYVNRTWEKDRVPEAMKKVIQWLSGKYKKRFVIRFGEHFRTVETDQILYFHSYEKATFLHTADDHNYVVDHSLDQLESMLDPGMFFRINRKYIVSMQSIRDIIIYSNSRLKLELLHCKDPDTIVARDKVNRFKSWLNG
ncbi:MAG: response regulator transcription factor [Bacteroidales bacterium]|nr:response regulator transcription factor [Bacteroidales bacterium]